MCVEKNIIVRVVEWTSGNERTAYPAQTVLVNATGGVEAAVTQVYPVFPGVCTRVVLVRGPVLLWHKHQRRWPSPGDSYALLQDGDGVEIQLYGRAAGPDKPSWPGWVPDGAGGPGDDRLPGPGRGEGPQAAGARLVSALLRQLGSLY